MEENKDCILNGEISSTDESLFSGINLTEDLDEVSQAKLDKANAEGDAIFAKFTAKYNTDHIGKVMMKNYKLSKTQVTELRHKYDDLPYNIDGEPENIVGDEELSPEINNLLD